MRIAYILPSLENRGPIIFTEYLIKGLKNKAIVEVFYFKDIVEVDLKVKCTKINFFSKIDLSSFDIVHSTMLIPDIYTFLKSINNKFIRVVSMHNNIQEDLRYLYPKFKTYLLFNLWRIVIANAKNIIISSESQKKYYKSILGSRVNFKLIPYGVNKKNYNLVDESIHNRIIELKSKSKIIGTCGLLIKRKGFDILIKALVKLPNHSLLIIGEGAEMESLKKIAFENKLSERVLFLGFRNNSIDFYQYFDIYAMTSYSEGFGLAMLEAISQGIPLVCSKLEIYQDYFSEDKICYFKPGDIQELIVAVLNISLYIEKYQYSSLEIYNKYFSIESMTQNHLNYYSYLKSNINSSNI